MELQKSIRKRAISSVKIFPRRKSIAEKLNTNDYSQNNKRSFNAKSIQSVLQFMQNKSAERSE